MSRAAPKRPRVAAVLLALPLLAAAASCDRGDPLPPDLTVEDVVAELPQTLAGLEISAQDAADRVRPGALQPSDRLRQGGGERPGLVTPPRARVVWRPTVPSGTVLRFAVAVQGDGQRDRARSGIRFSVAVAGRERWTHTLDPAATRDDRRWLDDTVDLDVPAAGPVEIVFGTDAEEPGRPLAGTPGWGHVRIVRRTTRPRQRAEAGPNVLVLLVDTMRADHLGIGGATPSPSPTLDALAAGGLVFTNTVSQSCWTLPSVASLMTGLHPRSHGAIGARGAGGEAKWGFLSDQVETWAETAARAGITTVGVSANPIVSRGTNLAQGFETFEELPWDPEGRNWASAADVNARFLAWLRANRGLRFAAWLHYMEPHDPYTPPPDLRPPEPPGIRPQLAAGWVQDVARKIDWEGAPPLPAREVAWLQALYDAEIRGWDRELARLLAALDAEGLHEHTIVVVTADHGEEFQEHGRLKHGSQLYEESIHVPLVLVGPGIAPGRIATLAQGIDLAPTLLALLGVPLRATLPGRDLRAAPAEDRAALAETSTGIGPDGAPIDVEALRAATRKLIVAPALDRREVYDLASDPGERHDLGPASAHGAALAAQLAAVAGSAAPPPARPEGTDAVLTQKLRTLGYVE